MMFQKQVAERIVKDMGKHFKQKKPKNPKHKRRVHLDSLVVQKVTLAVNCTPIVSCV